MGGYNKSLSISTSYPPFNFCDILYHFQTSSFSYELTEST